MISQREAFEKLADQAATIARLQADNQKLRKALEEIVMHDGQFTYLANEALGETK